MTPNPTSKDDWPEPKEFERLAMILIGGFLIGFAVIGSIVGYLLYIFD